MPANLTVKEAIVRIERGDLTVRVGAVIGAENMAALCAALRATTTLTALACDFETHPVDDGSLGLLSAALRDHASLQVFHASMADTAAPKDVEAPSLVTCCTGARLKTLRLTSCDYSAVQLAAAVRGAAKTLTTLEVTGNCTDEADPANAAALWDALRDSNGTCLATLKISLYAWGIGHGGARALAAMLAVNSTLTSLDLEMTLLGDQGGAALFDALGANGASALQTLNLTRTSIGNATVASAAKALGTAGLLSLDLSYNSLSDASMEQLAAALRVNTSLTSLACRGSNLITVAGIRALGGALGANRTLQCLDLSDSHRLDDDCAAALGAGLAARAGGNGGAVTSLNLMFCQFSLTGTAAICNALVSSVPLLVSIDLGYSAVGDDGAKTIGALLRASRTLRRLGLCAASVRTAGALAICDAPWPTRTYRSPTWGWT
jgi:hypothetical protein